MEEQTNKMVQAAELLNQKYDLSIDTDPEWVDLEETEESINNISTASDSWNECSTLHIEDNFLKIAKLQVARGERRYELYAVELDGKTYCYKSIL